MGHLQIVDRKGKLQKINVMVCTYNEDPKTVELCVRRLLDSPVPVYCSKHIYVGDDGAKVRRALVRKIQKGEEREEKLSELQHTEDKRLMVDRLHSGALAHSVLSRAE